MKCKICKQQALDKENISLLESIRFFGRDFGEIQGGVFSLKRGPILWLAQRFVGMIPRCLPPNKKLQQVEVDSDSR